MLLNTFLIAGASTPTQAHFGDGSGKPVWLDNVVCLGTENNLIDCQANPLGTSNCGHNKDVGTRCLPVFSKLAFKMTITCHVYDILPMNTIQIALMEK